MLKVVKPPTLDVNVCFYGALSPLILKVVGFCCFCRTKQTDFFQSYSSAVCRQKPKRRSSWGVQRSESEVSRTPRYAPLTSTNLISCSFSQRKHKKKELAGQSEQRRSIKRCSLRANVVKVCRCDDRHEFSDIIVQSLRSFVSSPKLYLHTSWC